MSFYPCGECGQRGNGKLATVYANWFDEQGNRAAWRKRYCVQCLTSLMVGLQAGRTADSNNLSVCPVCGEDSAATLSGIFLTVYPPKQESREYALPTCGSCADLLRKALQSGADQLGDRGVGAAAPTQPQQDQWSQIPW